MWQKTNDLMAMLSDSDKVHFWKLLEVCNVADDPIDLCFFFDFLTALVMRSHETKRVIEDYLKWHTDRKKRD
jgi:hypothetical protein